MLAVLGNIPFWLLVLVLVALLAMDIRVEIRPIWMSKLNTFLQIVLVVLVLVLSSEWLALDRAISVVIVMVVFRTLSSGMSYIRTGVKQATLES